MIILPHRITREIIRTHLDVNFVHSCDVARKSFFGQSYHAFGEPNSFPVSVMWKACRSSGYFQDSQYREILEILNEEFRNIPRDKPIIVFPKIGRGHSRMFEFAPKAHNYLESILKSIGTEYEINYAI